MGLPHLPFTISIGMGNLVGVGAGPLPLSITAGVVARQGPLAPPSPQRWQRMLAQPRANRRQAGGAALLPATAAFLRGFYAPHNAQLAYWLGDDRWLWGDVHAARPVVAGNATRE